MKRSLLLAAVLAAPLYLRQREVERRQREWRAQRDKELGEMVWGMGEEYRRFGKEVNEEMARGGQQWRRWADRLAKEIERAGARR